MPTVGIGRNGGVCAQRRCMSAQRRCMSRFLLAGRATALYVKGSKAHRRCMCEFGVICEFFNVSGGLFSSIMPLSPHP